MKRSHFLWTIALLTAIGLCAAGWVYGRLPEWIPLHWNIRGETDGRGPRFLVWVFALLPMVVSGLMAVFPPTDFRKAGAEKQERAFLITLGLVSAVLFSMFGFVLAAALGMSVGNAFFVIPLILGLGLIVLGNVTPQIRKNRFFGIRTPWTLANEEVWRKTHRFGAYAFVVSGFLLIGTAFFLRSAAGLALFIATIPAALVLVTAYSFWEYRRRFPKP